MRGTRTTPHDHDKQWSEDTAGELLFSAQYEEEDVPTLGSIEGFASNIKFADSWNGSGEAENPPLLTKHIETFSTIELVFNISKLA